MEKAVQNVKEIAEIFALGSFPLRKWVANRNEVLADLPCEYLAMEPSAPRDAALGTYILGLFWNPTDDSFGFKLSSLEPSQIVTKRTILSRIARLFDPLGWLAPIVVLAKMLMRELWISKTGWNDPITPECDKL